MIKAVLRAKELSFETKAGLFSREHVDTGSKLLIESLEIKPDDTILDIGCGYGPIGLAAAYAAPQGKVFMVDVDIRAIKMSKKNAITNQIHNVFILPSDGFEDVPADVPLNLVVSNPPSHTPKETVLQFISDAHRQLVKGLMVIVAPSKANVAKKKIIEIRMRDINNPSAKYFLLLSCLGSKYSLLTVFVGATYLLACSAGIIGLAPELTTTLPPFT
jgi:16S rRNA (guanine1207-N2)-methyltransferase